MKSYDILGLMSGTSLDGLDLAACRFSQSEGIWQFKILASASLAYEPEMKAALSEAMDLQAPELLALHHRYGKWLGQQATAFLQQQKLEVDAIASHGHTVHHRPDQGYTFQLGSGHDLAVASDQLVICDFRSADVALGGQGAPLVPIGDRLLFGEYQACLNLGGISNISFEQQGKRLAYDIGVANMPLNYLSQKRGMAYDNGGQLAATGKLLPELLKALNDLPFYRQEIPRSTGAEWFRREVKPLLDQTSAPIPDLLHTTTLHIAQQLASALSRHANGKSWRVLLTGGGAMNDFLLDQVRALLPETIRIEVPDRELLEQKEALVFAFLGALRLEAQLNVLASVTGASKDSCSGVLYLPGGKQ